MFAEPLDPSLRNRPSVLSVDSGYGSTTSPTSSTFDWAKRDAYERWKQADEASQMLAEEERAVEEAIGRLKHAKAAASQQTKWVPPPSSSLPPRVAHEAVLLQHPEAAQEEVDVAARHLPQQVKD